MALHNPEWVVDVDGSVCLSGFIEHNTFH